MGKKEDLLRRCRREGTPLMEEDRAIFVWQGEDPPRLMGDFNGWEGGEPLELTPAGDGLWVLEMEFPADAYIEYIYIDEAQERVFDPLNPRKTPNGMGKTNQYFYMKAGKPTPWIVPHKGTPRGEVTRADLPTAGLLAGKKRTVHFYQPPVDDPAPLLLVWDGGDYYRRAKLTTMVDELIAARKIEPVALAMLENGGPARMMEYACGETTLWYVMAVLLPEAKPAQPVGHG